MEKKTKLKVRPEGRKDIWLPDRKSLMAYVKERCGEKIHNFIPMSMIMLGADHSKKSVLDDIKRADRLAVFTDATANMGHSLAVITGEKLECFDIGRIDENDLVII